MPVLSGNSFGAIRPGQSLRQVASICPRALADWKWNDTGADTAPQPVLVVNMGGAIAELTLEDTLASSAVVSVSVLPLGPVLARTAEGVGPGSTLADLVRAYGEPRIEVDQCRLYATFARTEGLMFELPLRNGLTCADVDQLAKSRDRVPRETRVGSVIIRRFP